MSADEIRRLVRIYSAKEKSLKYELDRFKDAETMPNLDNISNARKDAIMTVKALLAYASMVERCETEIAKLPYPPNGSDVYWFRKLNYILEGATDERK